MSEEEKRRCIILGLCGGGSGLASNDEARKQTLAEYLNPDDVSEENLTKLLGLIDEALSMSAE